MKKTLVMNHVVIYKFERVLKVHTPSFISFDEKVSFFEKIFASS